MLIFPRVPAPEDGNIMTGRAGARPPANTRHLSPPEQSAAATQPRNGPCIKTEIGGLNRTKQLPGVVVKNLLHINIWVSQANTARNV